MNSITRKIDELGRIVIPSGMRKKLGWEEKDNISIVVTNDGLLLTKAK